jgi:hypothetical protein
MNTGKTIFILGISLILLYTITTILNFYGIGPEIYGIYITFYLFLLLSYFVLPRDVPSL